MSSVGAQKRTNVRINPAALAAIRTTFGVLGRVAPGQGVVLAERIWCHVPSSNGARRDLRPGPGEIITARVDGRRVVAEAWGQGPAVYLSSGWGGWRGHLGAMVNPLVSAGFRAVAFDALSHGQSDAGSMGRGASTLSEFADSLTAVVGQAGPAHAVIAHSAGCVAAALAAGDGLTVNRMVFLAPMADPMPYIGDFCHILNVNERLRTGMVRRLEERVGRSLDDFDVLRLAPRLGVPLLIFHDRDDKETRFGDGEAIAAKWPGAELVASNGLGHRRILSDLAVVSRAVEFVKG